MDTKPLQKNSGEKSLDQNFQLNLLEAQIRECFGRVVWTHKSHEKCCDIVNKRHSRIQIVQIVLSTVITTGILVTVFGEQYIIGVITALISALQIGVNSYVKGYDFGSIAQKHSDAAVQLWNIRESYLSLLTDMKAKSLSFEEITSKRDQLQNGLSVIYSGSPRILSTGYNKVTKALKINQELTFSDDEIDMLLPRELRKQQP